MTQIAYKFVKHETPSLESLSQSFEYKIKQKLINNEKLTREEKNRLASELSTSMQRTNLRLRGWAFSFREFVNEYWVEFTHGGIHPYYTPDKTSLRACLSSVNRIIDVTNKNINS